MIIDWLNYYILQDNKNILYISQLYIDNWIKN